MMTLFMSNMDIFSIPVQLNYKNQYFFKSGIGFVSSFIILAMVSTMSIFLLKDLFQHAQAIVVSKTEFSVSPKDFELTSENFQVAVTVQDQYNMFIFNTPEKKFFDLNIEFFDLVLTQENGIITPELNINQGLLRTCTSEDATYGIDPMFIINFQCLDQATFLNKYIALGGDNSQPHVKFARVQILKCVNSPECASLEEVDAILNGARVNIAFNDFFLDSTNYEKPLQKVMRVKQFGIENQQLTRTMMWMRRISVQSDENFFLFNNKRNQEEGLQFQYYETNFNQQINNSQSMPSMNEFIFVIEQKEEYTYRTYGNVLEVMAYIGGFYRFLTLLASIIINPVVKKHYTKKLISDVNEKQQQSTTVLQQYSKRKLSSVYNKTHNNSSFDNLFLYCQKNQQANSIKEDEILQYLDVRKIIQLTQEIQKLKNFLLTKEQKILLNLIPVPFNIEKQVALNDINELEDSIKFLNNQNNIINQNIKQSLFGDEIPYSIDLSEFGKNSVIPDEIKSSQRDLQEYQFIAKSKRS